MSTLKKTSLYSLHVSAGARMVPFAGYEMPVQYQSVLEETKNVRRTAGLFDVSHMGQISLRGKEALTAINKLVTNDLTKLSLGQAQYNILCYEDGGTVDDLVVYYRNKDWVYLCVNASNLEKDREWIQSHLDPQIKIEDESEETSLLALQGPQSEKILQAHTPFPLKELKYYWAAETKLFDVPVYLSRTGYTGEDGFEIYLKNSNASLVWTKFLEAGEKQGLQPAGLAARDTLRLEMGYALYGHELDEKTTPLEAKLGWVVKLQKNNSFLGQKALLQQQEKGCSKKLISFTLEDKRLPRQGYSLFEGEKKVGVVTSGGFSPHLEAPIALGFIESSAKQNLSVQVRTDFIPLQLTPLPFVPSRTHKS